MLELLETIKSLAKEANTDIDVMDIGITLSEAMTREQIEDLAAMIEYLRKTDMSAREVLYNALHDLQGLKSIFLEDEAGLCFSPRSTGYRLKAS